MRWRRVRSRDSTVRAGVVDGVIGVSVSVDGATVGTRDRDGWSRRGGGSVVGEGLTATVGEFTGRLGR